MSSNYENVLWNFGDGNTSIDDNPHNIYTNDGFFDIKLTAITNSGCLTDTITKSIFVTSPLNINEVNNRKVIRTINILGSESIFLYKPLIYIYDDGTVEKVIINKTD